MMHIWRLSVCSAHRA